MYITNRNSENIRTYVVVWKACKNVFRNVSLAGRLLWVKILCNPAGRRGRNVYVNIRRLGVSDVPLL